MSPISRGDLLCIHASAFISDFLHARSHVTGAHTHIQPSVRVWSDEGWAKSKWKDVGFQG